MIKTNPDDRRIIMCAWNPKGTEPCALRECCCIQKYIDCILSTVSTSVPCYCLSLFFIKLPEMQVTECSKSGQGLSVLFLLNSHVQTSKLFNYYFQVFSLQVKVRDIHVYQCLLTYSLCSETEVLMLTRLKHNKNKYTKAMWWLFFFFSHILDCKLRKKHRTRAQKRYFYCIRSSWAYVSLFTLQDYFQIRATASGCFTLAAVDPYTKKKPIPQHFPLVSLKGDSTCCCCYF